MDARQQLLALARAYADKRKLSLARVATLAVNHGGFFKKLEEGTDFTFGTYERCTRWFAANWPEDLDWPASVPRPKLEGAAA